MSGVNRGVIIATKKKKKHDHVYIHECLSVFHSSFDTVYTSADDMSRHKIDEAIQIKKGDNNKPNQTEKKTA